MNKLPISHRSALPTLRFQRKVKLFTLCILLFSSCMKEQEDFFEQSASERMQGTLDKVRSILRNSQYGWELEYYPSSTLDYGGIVYTVRFDSLKATVGCSLIPDSTETTFYRLTNDSGPVLSFDTYNPLLHYFSTPSSGEYEAKGGEFEFVISDIKEDIITLYGKKTRNSMYLRKLTGSPDEYAQKTIEIYDNFISSFEGTIGTAEVKGQCKLNNKSIELISDGDTTTLHFTYNDRGIRLYSPLNLGGQTVQTFAFNKDTYQLSCLDAGSEHVVLQGEPFGDDILPFKDFEGNYNMRYNNNQSTVQISLVPSRIDGTYRLRGLSREYEVILNYDYTNGHLTLGPQVVGDINGRTVYLCTYGTSEDGGIFITEDATLTIAWNGNRFYPSYNFSATFPNTYPVDSLVLVMIYTNADGNLTAALVEEGSWLIGNRPTINNITSLVRVRA